jgi:phage shock protein E
MPSVFLHNSRMRAVLAITTLFIIVTGFVYLLHKYAQDSDYRISNQTAKQLLASNGFDVVLDVRTNLERETLGNYPGSTHIQSGDLEHLMPNLFPDQKIRILVYCNTGQRARRATDILHAMGYKNTVYISGSHKSIM